MSATKEQECATHGRILGLRDPSITSKMLKESAIRSVEQGLPIQKAFLYFNTSPFSEVGNVSYQMSDDISILKQSGAQIVSGWKPGTLIIDLGAG